VKRTATLLILITLFALGSAGCSTDNTSTGGSQTEAVKPPPQVRVETMPPTATLPLPEELLTPTLELTATPAQVYTWPTPNEDEIINQIDSMMDQLDHSLNTQKFNFNP